MKKDKLFFKDNFFLAPQNILQLDRYNQFLLIDKETGKWIRTNEVGKEIILFCKNPVSYENILQHLLKKYSLEKNIISKSILPFLKGAISLNFLSYFNTKENKDLFKKKESLLNKHLSIWLHITNYCSLNCKFCINNSSTNIKSSNHLNLNDFNNLFSELNSIENLKITISGGEPSSRSDVLDILSACKKIKGLKRLVFITNGIGTSANKFIKISRLVDLIQFSIDGTTQDFHDKIRGKGTFNKIIKNINSLKKLKLNNYSISFTPIKHNISEMHKMVDFAFNLGAKGLHINRLMPGGRAKRNINSLIIDDHELKNEIILTYKSHNKIHAWHSGSNKQFTFFLDISGELNENVLISKKRLKCGWGTTILSIDPYGNVYPCPSLHINKFLCGNIRNSSFSEIYNKTFKKYHKLNVNKYSKCSSCDIKYLCGGGCRARTYHVNKSIFKDDPLCEQNYYNIIEKCWRITPYSISSSKPFKTS